MMQIDNYGYDRRKKRKKQRLYLLTGAVILVFYLLLYGIFWFILRSPIFRVDKVVVQGNTVVPSADVLTLLQSSALRDHSLWNSVLGFKNMMIWPDTLSANELMLIPQLAGVTLDKDYFAHTITANVSERQPFGIWCFENTPGGARCYWFDDTGTIFQKSFDTEGGAVYVVHDASQKTRGLNETVLPDEFLPNFISIVNVLRGSGLGIQNISLADLSLEEVHVITTNGPMLYFSLRFPADNDLPVIKGIMQQPGFAKIQYIDARTENRVYYK
jgi:hypothetical protein